MFTNHLFYKRVFGSIFIQFITRGIFIFVQDRILRFLLEYEKAS